MIVNDYPLKKWVHLDEQVECEGCGRSLMGRFSAIPYSSECDSCVADFDRLMAAGKLKMVDADE